MPKVTVPLKDIQLSQLNNECLVLVGKFVRALKAKKGITLRMQDRDILVQISTHSHKSKDSELKDIYSELKQEMLKSVHQSLDINSSHN